LESEEAVPKSNWIGGGARDGVKTEIRSYTGSYTAFITARLTPQPKWHSLSSA
jgi:hypothetical protein